MAKKGKAKISKIKRNNQTTNKMKKQGKMRLQRHRNKVQKQHAPEKMQVEYSSESEPSGDEWADMLDEEEQQYIMSRIASQPQLLANIPENEEKVTGKKRRKQVKERMPKRAKMASDSGAETDDKSQSGSETEIEEKYEKEQADRPTAKKMKPLLPIKTKEGLVERAEECEDTESEEEQPIQTKKQTKDNSSESDSGLEGTGEVEDDEPADTDVNVVTTVQLLAARRDKLQHDKLRIGALCSSLLESPEKKLKNLYPILYLMEERLKDETLNLHSVRKLASLSACEVFKDILPDYNFRHQDYSNVKLKKDTLALYKYEKELLEFYKRYLQRLEKAAAILRRKKGDNRKIAESDVKLAVVSLQCMCNLLVTRPNFNYATNIAQSVIPFLDCKEPSAREIVRECCVNVFADDNKGEITLSIVRLINLLVKRRGERLTPSALDCLLTLRIRDIDMDKEADIRHKKKQEEKHKKRIVNLSKKEKKRVKKLKEVERELLETEAQENEMARRKQLTEVTKTVFHIYFRLLKSAPRSKLLAAALNGLAKFTHVINMEYYLDLVSILGRLIADQVIGPREKLLVVRTVLAILAGAGDALNVDPAKFHAYLYTAALTAHAGSSHDDVIVVVEAATQICARARRVSAAVLQAFAKRLTTLTLQVQHNGALACLALIHHLTQQSKPVSSLFDADTETAGSGRFDPTLDSPEHCNAHAASLHELCALINHYHPTVRECARALLDGKPLPDLAKLSSEQIFEKYDGSQMAFKPSIPPPKKVENVKNKPYNHVWLQRSLKEICESVESSVELNIDLEKF